MWKTTSGVVPTGGKATVTLDNPGRFERITAVVVNGSYDKSGWNGQDWNWTRDQQPVSLAATALTGGGPRVRPGRPGGRGTGSAAAARRGGPRRPGPAAARTAAAAPPAAARGGGGSHAAERQGRRPAAARQGQGARADRRRPARPGTFTATATVDAATAKRLGLGRRATTIGTGRLALPSGGAGTLKIGLTAKARARLKRSKRPVTVAVRLTFKSAAGATTARTITLKLKP